MTTGLALAAGLLSLPVASNDVWSAPHLRLDGQGAGQVFFQLLVAPDRTVQTCDIVYSDFSESVGAESCARLREAVFDRAALDAGGHPVHGSFLLVSSRIARGVRAADAVNRLLPDLTVTVENLPAAYGSEVLVRVILEVAPDGRSRACEGIGEVSSALAEAACAQARNFEYPTVSNVAGEAVPYVRELRVNFVEQPQP